MFEKALAYLEGKGQLYSAPHFSLLYTISEVIKDFWGVDVELLSRYADRVVSLSQIERSRWATVAQANVRSLFEGLKQETVIQEHVPEKVRLLSLRGSEKK